MITEYGYWMRILLTLDIMFNVVTGGELGVCFSTRAYLNSEGSWQWFKVMLLIDYVFWVGHCKDSYEWKVKCKNAWLVDKSKLQSVN